MGSVRWSLLTVVALLAAPLAHAGAPESAANSPPFNIHQRELWTTGNIHGIPDPPDPYTTEIAFPKLTFFEPLSVGLIPGSNKFGVATRPGKIYAFEIRPDVDSARLILDLKKTTYSIVFHPDFARNGYFYVMYIVDTTVPQHPTGSRLSRFQWKPGTPIADPRSETVILEWPSGGHNGGCMRFGPDGFLYVATGDGSGIADSLQTGQNISDYLGAILRIDVNQTSAGRNYTVPADNPFVSTPNARPEIWSYGHRQIWKFSFDRQGHLWGGEVGQDLWEMIYLIKKGGNYGWSVREGRYPFRPERPKGPTDFVDPIVEHPHSDFRSITGGFVCESDRIPELKGAYIYGDYDTGRLWSFIYKDGKATQHHQLADSQIRIVEFAQDPAGDVYAVDFPSGTFHRIVPAPPQPAVAKPFPRKLSETGLFASTKDNLPAKGLIPYSVNAPLWSDGADKQRFIAIPGNGQIEIDDVIYPHGVGYPDLGWRFPDGTVLVKTFSMQMKEGDPQSSKRLETRILQYRKMPGNDDEYGAQYWFGYTYIWNADQTDAELAPAEGVDQKLSIQGPGGVREVNWRFPSRSECALCHTMAAKYILGVTTLQMNKDHDFGGEQVANQLQVLEHLGVLKEKLPKPAAELPRLVDYSDASQNLNLRARSYLHANCAHCHRKWGGGNAEFELHASIPLTQSKAVNTPTGQGLFGINDPRVIAPGAPDRSMILHRMKLTSLGRMPHIASRVVDQQGAQLISDWLATLKNPADLEKPGALNPRPFIEQP